DLSTLLGSALAEWRNGIQPVPMRLVSTRDQAKTMAALADGLLHRQSNGFLVMDDDFITETFASAGITPPSDPVEMRLAGTTLSAGMAAYYLETAAALA